MKTFIPLQKLFLEKINSIRLLQVFFTLILLIHLFTKCTDKGVEVKPPKDPRTYFWTAETLGYPGSFQTIMYDIWGSSPTDVYTVGHNNQNRGLMWHFDGNGWTNVPLITSEGGQIEGAIDLTSIYGFSSNDIYAAGERIIDYNPNPPPNFIDSSLIIHYDGTDWRKVNVYKGRLIGDIYGSSQSDIWAGGWEKALYHYNGSIWETDSKK